MIAARFHAPKDVRLEDIPTPKPGRGDVVVKVVRCGMCGTDLSIFSGEASFIGAVRFPMTPGHEWSGVVETVGSEVESFKPGDRVVGDTGVSCGVCYECLIGQYHHCKKIRAVGTVLTWDGAYAEYILMPARHLFHLPDNVSFDNGAWIEPAATALYSVVLADVGIADTVLVNGTGPIGIMAAKQAKLCGASKVLIAGRKDFKLKKAREIGVDAAINVTKIPLAEAVKAELGSEPVDRVVEASGSVDMFKQSLKVIRPGGTMSLVAFYDKKMDGFNLDDIVFGDVKIVPVPGSLGMYKPVLRLMAAGMLDASSLITGRYTLGQVPQALADMTTRNDTRIKFMIDLA